MNEDIDTFAGMFAPNWRATQATHRKAREDSERRTQLTDRQRKRGAKRTTQINFRCSPAFKALAAAVATQLDMSVADVMEAALADFAKAKNINLAPGGDQ